MMSKRKNSFITVIAFFIIILIIIILVDMINNSPGILWVLAGFIIVLILSCIYFHYKFSQRAYSDPEIELHKIDQLEGYQFEEYIAKLLSDCGYADVIVTQRSGDYGADITAFHEEEIIGFQCKRASHNIGVQGVKDIAAGMQYYDCDQGVVVTNRHFTRQAQALAQKCGIELWDRDTLRQLIETAPHCI